MSKWFSHALSLLIVSAMFAQLLPAQWPQTGGSPQPYGQQYPQSSYPENPPQPQNQPLPNQPQSTYNPDPADLQHGVVRVSIAQGDVNLRRGDNGQLSGAVINTPLVSRDHLQTSNGSRAEVQLDAATFLRLAPNTDVGFADVQYHSAQIQLGMGTLIYRLLQNSPMQVEIDTPSVGIRALAPGDYRISVFDNGTSQVTVRTGQLELYAPRGSERLDAGRSVLIRGDAANPEMQDVAAAAPDQLDEWSQGRDSEVTPAQSVQYVNSDVQGAADLDRYGNWVPSTYGQAWRPQNVGPDWSPYSDGQWSYVDYYGWSWVDYSPWGWAPYHYGRWFYNSGYGWCWWPGPLAYRAYWSPALVGFFGFGGGIGWVALAPFELFHPWWGRAGLGFGYHGGFGIMAYRNAGFRGGALTTSLAAFGGMHQRFAAATRTQILSATAYSGRLPVTPNRASYSFSSRAAVPNSRLASVQSRSFYNSAQSRSFSTAPANRASGGWQTFGNPGSAASRQNYQSAETSGWHSFGQPHTSTNTTSNRYQSYQSTPRTASPNYQQPRSNYQQSSPRSYNQPRYQAPRQQSQPRTSAPAPHANSGGGGGHVSSGHASGGGGHHGR
jgi:hypothetical protein